MGETRRLSVTLPVDDLEFYEQVVKEGRRQGKRGTVADQIREAVREHIERLKRR